MTTDIVAQIKTHLSNPPLDEDGEPYAMKLLPPLDATAVTALESRYNCMLTDDVKTLLAFCGGFENGAIENVDFQGEDAKWILPSLNGRLICIAPDGYGNFWCYWKTAVNAHLGPIYYYQHEGPMLFYQSPTLIDFVTEYLKFMTPPYLSLIDDVHEFRLKPLKDINCDCLTSAQAAASANPLLQEFAASASKDCLFYDFTAAITGDGVDLKSYDVAAVHPVQAILALSPRQGLLQRFFSKRTK